QHQQYLRKDIRMNVLFTMNQKSIVTEVQFILKQHLELEQMRYPFYCIGKHESFLFDSLKIMQELSFDAQLQIASFHPRDMSHLMLLYPHHFQHSQFITSSRDLHGGNFMFQMANNSHVEYAYAKVLLQSENFIPFDVIQTQLAQKNDFGAYPLMFALWKQSSLDAIKLFIPKSPEQAHLVWNSFDRLKMSCIGYGVRNEKVDMSSMLRLLRDNIQDEHKWQNFIETPDAN
ncbi:hypothetical protein RFI_18310, partial [Reticulomyxa filosa]